MVRIRSRCASSSLPCVLEPRQPLLQLGLDAGDRRAHALVGRDVVRRGEHDELVELAELLAGERVDRR